MASIKSVSIENFKSIRQLSDFPLHNLNILIGANGAGKSNFISFFKLLNHIVHEELQYFVGKVGSVDSLLYFGQKKSRAIKGAITFESFAYDFQLEVAQSGKLFFAKESVSGGDPAEVTSESLGVGHFETQLNKYQKDSIQAEALEALKQWKIYHFHDTSETAGVKQSSDIEDNRFLRSDAANLAAVLYNLKQTAPQHYPNIVSTIRLVAPFFKDFVLKPRELNKSSINLEWLEVGSDHYFNAHHLSDGTLRMICLITLLMQPNLPSIILLDEPELGLHPYAIKLLASLLRSAATKTQVIVSTQSSTLVDQFQPADVVVVGREDQQTIFKRLEEEKLMVWLEDYSLGSYD